MATQVIIAGDTSFDAVGAGDSFYVTGGGQTIAGNVDGSGQNTSVLAEIGKAFTGQIGTAADPWQTAFSTRLVYAAAAGDIYFESDAADTETTALVQCIGGGHFHFVNAGIATRFESISGQVTVGNGAVITNGRFGGGLVNLLDTGSATALTILNVSGATVYSQRPHTTIILMSGSLTLDADAAGAVNAHTTINVYGGTLNLKDSGTITTLTWEGGMVNASQIARATTITNTNIRMDLPGAQALLDSPNITFTNTPTRYYTDGRPL